MVCDVPVLLKAEQEQAHVAAPIAHAVRELRRRQAGMFLERPADEPQATEQHLGAATRKAEHRARPITGTAR
jgi:hypothetical protein